MHAKHILKANARPLPISPEDGLEAEGVGLAIPRKFLPFS